MTRSYVLIAANSTKRGFLSLREPIPLVIRWAVVHRDSGQCRYCGRYPKQVEIDHVVPVADGGGTFLGNLVTACRTCNRRKGTKRWTPHPVGWQRPMRRQRVGPVIPKTPLFDPSLSREEAVAAQEKRKRQ